MVIDLLGILEAGGARGATVPKNPRVPLRFARGEDVLVRLRVIYSTGAPYTSPYATIRFSIRQYLWDGVRLAKQGVFVADQADGRWDITLSSADTKALLGSRYLYDVWLDEPGSGLRHPIIGLAGVIVEDAARAL